MSQWCGRFQHDSNRNHSVAIIGYPQVIAVN